MKILKNQTSLLPYLILFYQQSTILYWNVKDAHVPVRLVLDWLSGRLSGVNIIMW